MNYGNNEVARKLQRSSSKAQKVASKLVLWLVKLVLVLFTVGIILSVSLGYGIFKGIIDAAPEIDVASIEPSGYATMVYDSKGNLISQRDLTSLKDAATYDKYNNLLTYRQAGRADNVRTVLTYGTTAAEQQKRLLRTSTSPLGTVSRFAYDAKGNCTESRWCWRLTRTVWRRKSTHAASGSPSRRTQPAVR